MIESRIHTPLEASCIAEVPLHPAWITLIRFCQELRHGEIERLKIQDGIPVMVERSIQRMKLT